MGMVCGSRSKCMGVVIDLELMGVYVDFNGNVGEKGGKCQCPK